MRREGKPLMWDPSEGKAKPYDDISGILP